MSKKRMKTRLGADGIDYPYTSESLVFDNKGRSIDQKYATKEDLELYASMIPSGINIPENADLNTIEYLSIGSYYCSETATVKTLINCPVEVAFLMEVLNPLSPTIDNETTKDEIYRLRRLTHYSTGEQYIQFVSSDSVTGEFTYGEWNKTAMSSEIPTKVSQLENDKGYLTEHQSLEGLASETYVDNKVSNLVNSAPETLDTLNELAQALGEDPNFATTVSTQIGKKIDKEEGKSLISTSEIKRLANVDNYDDTEVRGLINAKANPSDIPIKVSQLTNDSGYITSIPSEYVTDSELTAKGYLTEHQDISHLVTQNKFDELELIETSATEPTDEDVVLWINTSEDTSTDILARINNNTVASNTTWSSSKIQSTIANIQINGGSGGNIDLSSYALKSDIPTKTSQLTNDSGYVTRQYVDNALNNLEIPNDGNNSGGTNGNLSNYATKEYVDDKVDDVFKSTLTVGYNSEEEELTIENSFMRYDEDNEELII